VFSHSLGSGNPVKCQHCEQDVALPFKCPFCSHYFCSEHRLPENHACPEYWKAKAVRREAPPRVISESAPKQKPYEYTITYTPQRPSAKLFWFSLTELKHLTISVLLVLGVGLSFALYVEVSPQIFVGLAILFTASFFLHELAHKLYAQHYGLWAEFRLTMFGALMTLLSIGLPFFKIIAPGVVFILGPVTKETAGKIALAGPLTNIMLSLVCIAVAFGLSNTFFGIVVIIGAWINAFIAIFNLIPFGLMDGLKVFWWNKIVWAIAFSASLILGVFTYMYLLK